MKVQNNSFLWHAWEGVHIKPICKHATKGIDPHTWENHEFWSVTLGVPHQRTVCTEAEYTYHCYGDLLSRPQGVWSPIEYHAKTARYVTLILMSQTSRDPGPPSPKRMKTRLNIEHGISQVIYLTDIIKLFIWPNINALGLLAWTSETGSTVSRTPSCEVWSRNHWIICRGTKVDACSTTACSRSNGKCLANVPANL